MAMLSPAISSFWESLSTLKFANRAKNIKNRPTINQDMTSKSLIKKYEEELKLLRLELEERNRQLQMKD